MAHKQGRSDSFQAVSQKDCWQRPIYGAWVRNSPCSEHESVRWCSGLRCNIAIPEWGGEPVARLVAISDIGCIFFKHFLVFPDVKILSNPKSYLTDRKYHNDQSVQNASATQTVLFAEFQRNHRGKLKKEPRTAGFGGTCFPERAKAKCALMSIASWS